MPLTIMLSQFGRQEFSDRFFAYLQKTSCPYPIIYADGDVDGFSADLCKKYKNDLDIKLVEYKQTQKFKDYFTMMVKGLEEVQTPFVMLCDNDDFIIYSSIEKLLTFLHSNPGYVSAGSPMIQMQLDNYSLNCRGKHATLINAYANYRIDEPADSWKDQVHNTFLDFQPNFYNIHKTEVLLQIWREILELDFSDLTIMEFYYQLRVPTFGKQHTDSSITHYVCQSGSGSWEGKTYDFSKELVNNNLPSDIRLMADRIGRICSKNFEEDYDNVYKAILDSYAKHLNNFLPHNVLRYRFPRLFNMKLSLVQIINQFRIINTLRFTIKEFRFKRSLKKIMGESYVQFMHEFKNIKTIIEK